MIERLKLFEGLTYTIIPSRCTLNSPSGPLHERAYIYWRDFWNEVFATNGDPGALNRDDFLRQDFISVIHNPNEIVAVHLYTKFDLRLSAYREHSYLRKSFNELYLSKLEARGAKTALSVEYLTVNPSYRKSKTGISFAMVMTGIATKIQLALEVDVCVAVSRTDVKVPQSNQEFGAEIIQGNVMVHNTPCDYMALFADKIVEPANATVNAVVTQLWSKRTDHTNLTTHNKTKSAAA